MTGTLLHQGLTLLAYGMGVVFLFLTMLVGATSLMSWLVMRYAGPQELQSEIMPPKKRPQQTDQQLTSVISAAIHHYRARHKKRH